MLNADSRLERSRSLHLRVREFARRALGAPSCESVEALGSFEDLACEICAFQTGKDIHSLAEVIRHATVSDAFRMRRVFAFDVDTASAQFVTSGTTGANSGVHYLRDTATYETASLLWGARGLGVTPEDAPPLVIALAPWTGRKTASSLGYMMQRMMEAFDGRGLDRERSSQRFALDAPERWLVGERGVDVAGLRRVQELAQCTGARVVLLATSFALVELLDAAGSETFTLPAGSLVMPTGGFKGRTRTIDVTTMHRELRRLFGDIDIVGEYGMTELTSQLYEGTLRGGDSHGAPGTYWAPPWLRVVALAAESLQPVSEGEEGLACFIDLGNVDSAVCLITQDRVRVSNGGVVLLGRQPKAPLRGCSLAIEALLRPDANRATLAPRFEREVWRASQLASDAERAAGVRRVTELVNAASKLRAQLLGPGAAAAAELEALAKSAGHSLEGTRAALELALEWQVSQGEIASLVNTAQATYGVTSATVWVLLSANVFTAPLRAIALALALSERVQVRASRREPVFTHCLYRAAPHLFGSIAELAPHTGDLVLAYGSDETLTEVESTLPEGVTLFGHGHGMGVAVIGQGAADATAADALALDVALFDQQGCLSPRLVLIDAHNPVDNFVEQLALALERVTTRLPSANVDSVHLHERAWSLRLAENLAGFARVRPAGDGWVALFDVENVHRHDIPIPPACRSLSVAVTVDSVADLRALGNVVTCVGVAGSAYLHQALALAQPGARVCALGEMQRPAFDGPVDRRRVPR